MINKKAQFNEFVKLYSALMNEEFNASMKGTNPKKIISRKSGQTSNVLTKKNSNAHSFDIDTPKNKKGNNLNF